MSVSETIGKLLLEGYKMLAESCEVCCTVLMQDRRGRIICVQCESTSMANQANDVNGDILPATGKVSNGGSVNHDNILNLRSSLNGHHNSASHNNSTTSAASSTFVKCETVLTNEIKNAATSLELLTQQQHEMQGKLMYIKYIRECAETIQALRAINKA